MMNKNIAIALILLFILALVGSFLMSPKTPTSTEQVEQSPQTVTLSGTYECLPHINTTGPQTDECAFGLKTDDGVHYAVNFGASADAMQQFQSGAHITAKGFVVAKEALNTDQWSKYDMKGIFTITTFVDTAPTVPRGKININAVCESALSYMTFPDGASADTFIAECREGKHPEVVEHYKAQMNAGDGAAI